MNLNADSRALPHAGESADVRRATLFHETPMELAERVLLGTACALKPERIAHLPSLGRVWISDLLQRPHGLPDPEKTYTDAGLCGIVHDISPPTLVEAYKKGLFTFAHFGPLKWMSPDERCVLFFDEMHISKKLRRSLRQGRYRVTFDKDFESVIKACAGRRDGKWHVTWITPHIMQAYAAMFDAGYVHSFEVWNEAGALVGGGYGVAIGRAFYTESQFSLETDTSKLGFTVLNWHLNKWGYALNDGKGPTTTIVPMGFRMISRREFMDLLAVATEQPGKTGRWSVEAELSEVANWQPPQPAAKGA